MLNLPATSIDPEERCYPAGSLRQSRRYGQVLCSDGKVRRVKLGIPDTFFTIPATCRIAGKSVSGYVAALPLDFTLAPNAPEGIDKTLAFYPMGAHKNILPSFDTLKQTWKLDDWRQFVHHPEVTK